ASNAGPDDIEATVFCVSSAPSAAVGRMERMSRHSLSQALHACLESFVAKGIVGASACVIQRRQQPVAAAAGLVDRTRGPRVAPSHLFKIGSATKSFVAVTLVQLAESGTVSLDAPIAAWFPNLPNADRIRVRQLINHRSGIPEFELHMPMDPKRLWRPVE